MRVGKTFSFISLKFSRVYDENLGKFVKRWKRKKKIIEIKIN